MTDEGTKACPECAENIKEAAILCPFCKYDFRTGKGPAAAGVEKARDLTMEGHLRGYSISQRVFAVIFVILGLILLLFGATLFGSMRGENAPSGMAAMAGGLMTVIGVIYLVLGTPLFFVGHFLWKYSNVARIVSGIFSILLMLGALLNVAGGEPQNIIGAIIGLAWWGACTWLVFNGRAATICSDEYRAMTMRSPQKPSAFRTPFFWIPIGLLGLGCLCMIGAVMLGMAAAGSRM